MHTTHTHTREHTTHVHTGGSEKKKRIHTQPTQTEAGVTRHVGHPPPSRPVVHRGALSGRPATLPLPCVDCEYGCSVGTGSTRWHPPCCRARPCHRTAVCGGATIVCRPPAGTLLYTSPCSWWAASTSDPSCPCACRWDLNTAPPDGTAVFGRAVAGTRAAP